MARPIVVAILILTACGCQKLNDQRTVKLSSEDFSCIIIDSASRQQEVTVDFQAGEPIDFYLVLEKNREELERALALQKKYGSALHSGEDVQKGTAKVTVPAKESLAIVLVSRGRATEVSVKTTGN